MSSTQRPTNAALLGVATLVLVSFVGVSSGRAAGSPAATALDVKARFAKQIAAVKRGTDIPVLLPASLPTMTSYRKLYLAGLHHPERWSVTIGAAPGCGSATACFVASFAGRRGAVLARPNLRLPGGQRARYLPIRCGASCGPASISFLHRDVLYDWRLKEPPPGGGKALAQLAGAAIAASRP